MSKFVDEVRVELRERSYSIHIGKDILGLMGSELRTAGFDGKLSVISTPPIIEFYGKLVMDSLVDAGFEVFLEEVPDSEESKSLEMAGRLYDRFVAHGLERNSVLLALGGGVVGDLAGFVAATFKRGLPFIQVPTTLLSQVDSSIGGKVAVNHPLGKNLIGAFYQPSAVFVDIHTLRTLPRRDFVAGVAEVIRYGAVRDREFFAFLESNLSRLLNLDNEVIRHAIRTSCAIKARIVTEDERETSGVRTILNYGHTIGHALETLTDYKVYKHGEAVAIGMVYAARLASRIGVCSRKEADRQEDLISAAGLPTSLRDFDPKKIIHAMGQDKKIEGGKLRFVLTEKVGRVNIYADITHDILLEVLSQN